MTSRGPGSEPWSPSFWLILPEDVASCRTGREGTAVKQVKPSFSRERWNTQLTFEDCKPKSKSAKQRIPTANVEINSTNAQIAMIQIKLEPLELGARNSLKTVRVARVVPYCSRDPGW